MRSETIAPAGAAAVHWAAGVRGSDDATARNGHAPVRRDPAPGSAGLPIPDEWCCGVDPGRVPSIADLLDRARQFPHERIALHAGEHRRTFGEVIRALDAGSADATGDGTVGELTALVAGLVAHGRIVVPDGPETAPEPRMCTFGSDAVAAAVADRRAVVRSRRAVRRDPAQPGVDLRLVATSLGTTYLLVEWLSALADGATLVPVATEDELVARLAGPATHVTIGTDWAAQIPAHDDSGRRWDLLGNRDLRVAASVCGSVGYLAPGYLGPVARGPLDGTARVRPVPGARMLVCDAAGRPVPVAVPGTVHIGGTAGASATCEATAGLRRTGAPACWTSDGHLRFAEPVAAR